MGQMGFFDIANRYAGLDTKNDPLVKIDAVVSWEDFRVRLEAAWRKPPDERKSNAGCKPWNQLRFLWARPAFADQYTAIHSAPDCQYLPALPDRSEALLQFPCILMASDLAP